MLSKLIVWLRRTISIQASRSAIAAVDNLPPGGIFNCGSTWRTALTMRLSAGLPGVKSALTPLTTVEQQVALQFVGDTHSGRMATVTLLNKQRPDAFFKKSDAANTRLSPKRPRTKCHQEAGSNNSRERTMGHANTIFGLQIKSQVL